MLEYLSIALTSFMSIEVIIALIVGVVGGMVIGIIPGLGPSVGIALLLPISFSMSPTAALVMMTAMYTTGVYGGSITAVLCHTPGTAASAATTMDGYEMTKQGRGMEAISVVTVASVVGGIIGGICLILFAPALGKISLMFSTLEYFLVACFGVLVVAGLTGENQAKGIFAALFGLLIGCIGMDSISGVSRFTFGQLWLEDGLDSTPILIGLFSISQVLILVEKLMRGTGSTIVEDPSAGLKGKRWRARVTERSWRRQCLEARLSVPLSALSRRPVHQSQPGSATVWQNVPLRIRKNTAKALSLELQLPSRQITRPAAAP